MWEEAYLYSDVSIHLDYNATTMIWVWKKYIKNTHDNLKFELGLQNAIQNDIIVRQSYISEDLAS